MSKMRWQNPKINFSSVQNIAKCHQPFFFNFTVNLLFLVTQTNHPHATCSTRGQNHHRLVQQLDPFVKRDPQNLQVFVEISIDANFKALVAQTKAHCLVLSIMTTSQQKQNVNSGIAIISFFDPFLDKYSTTKSLKTR